MSAPVLILQGFQRAFVEHDSPLFSRSASLRRGVCERLLKNARSTGWLVVHSYLALESLARPGAAAIDGFSPAPSEAYFRQTGLSAFSTPGFYGKFDGLAGRPAFLVSFAGLSAIASTFLDALERRIDLSIVADATADIDHAGVGEQERLVAIDTLARAHDRRVMSSDLLRQERPSNAPFYMAIGGGA